MLFVLAFAFLAGIVTVLSPCILPILPIILSSSTAGGKRRPIALAAREISFQKNIYSSWA
jgi:cytochrome c-type biogenesis protein